MAEHLGEPGTAAEYRGLFERGRQWVDRHLFNGAWARSSYRRRSVRNACRRSRRRLEAPRPRETTRTSLTVRMALMSARSVPVLVRVTGRGAAAKPIPNQTSAVIRSPACPESWRRSTRCSKRRGSMEDHRVT